MPPKPWSWGKPKGGDIPIMYTETRGRIESLEEVLKGRGKNGLSLNDVKCIVSIMLRSIAAWKGALPKLVPLIVPTMIGVYRRNQNYTIMHNANSSFTPEQAVETNQFPSGLWGIGISAIMALCGEQGVDVNPGDLHLFRDNLIPEIERKLARRGKKEHTLLKKFSSYKEHGKKSGGTSLLASTSKLKEVVSGSSKDEKTEKIDSQFLEVILQLLKTGYEEQKLHKARIKVLGSDELLKVLLPADPLKELQEKIVE